MAGENQFLFHALFMGVYITFVYDLLRIFRRVIPHSTFFVSLEDLIFWIYCAAEVFLLMYHESDGTLRWFAVIGALAGMFSYKKLISPFFVKYMALALNRILEILGKVVRFLCRPLFFAGGKAGKACGRAGGRLGQLFRRGRRAIKNKLTSFLKLLKMNLRA